jgi:1-acyl-sn-glycerol-3-phosphate acyltransferase
LRHGESIVVFPEGSFGREAGLKPFHSGAFMAASLAAAPLVVAGLHGTRAALRAETWWPQRRPIGFEVGPVLAPPGRDWSATARLRTAARAEMARLCGEFASPT